MRDNDYPQLSNSEITTWNRCPRQWYYNYYLGRLPMKRNQALDTGTFWHDLMEIYYNDPTPDGQEAARRHLWEASILEGQEEAIDYELLLVMLDGYFQWLEDEGVDHRLKFHHVEETGEATLSDGVTRVRCKIDIIAENLDTGEYFLQDHKTGKDFGVFDGLLLNQQMRTYALIANRDPLLPDIQGAIYSVARKIKRNNTAKPPFFRREPIYLNKGILENHERQVIRRAEEIYNARDELDSGEVHADLVVPPSVQYDCPRCPYFDVCVMQDDPHSDAEWALETNFRLANPNERYGEKEGK